MVSTCLNTFRRLGHDGLKIETISYGKANTSVEEIPLTSPQEVAEIVAIQALSFVAGDPERLGQFLAESGIGPETLRTAAANPQFLASVLDFVMRDDATVKAFATASQLHPTNIAAAHQALNDPAKERDVP